MPGTPTRVQGNGVFNTTLVTWPARRVLVTLDFHLMSKANSGRSKESKIITPTGLAVTTGDGDGTGVGPVEATGFGDAKGDGDGLGFGVAETTGVGDTDGEGLGEGSADTTGDGVILGSALGLGTGDAE